jgi:aspartate/methionine/tyrosine aminotransferase
MHETAMMLTFPLGQIARGFISRFMADRQTLDVSKVAVVPGEAFGTPGYLRLSYAPSDADLIEGITRLQTLAKTAVN